MSALIDMLPGALVVLAVAMAAEALFDDAFERGRVLGECEARCSSVGEARLRGGECECVVGVTPVEAE